MQFFFCKAVMKVVKKDILIAADHLQVCSSVESGCEAAVHAMRQFFDESKIEDGLLVNASNAFLGV